MIYLDRELVKSGRELLFKEPVHLRENDSDIKLMFNIKNLDIHFKDNKIYYKISIVGDNYNYTSEQQLFEKGYFILDIPDDVPVGTYMMLISLIDSEFDSIITLNPVNEFIIVEESLINIVPDIPDNPDNPVEPEEPEEPETVDLNYYVLKDGIIDETIISYKSNAFGVCSAQINENNNLNIVNTGDNPFLESNWLPKDRNNFYMYGFYDDHRFTGDAFSYKSASLDSSNYFYMYECYQYATVEDGTSVNYANYYSSVYLNTNTKMKKYFISNDSRALQAFTTLGYIQEGCEIIFELNGGESTFGTTSLSLPNDLTQYKTLNLEISEYKCSDLVNDLPCEIILSNSEGNIYKHCIYDCNNCNINIDLSTITNFENIKLDIRISGCSTFINIEKIYLEPKEVEPIE